MILAGPCMAVGLLIYEGRNTVKVLSPNQRKVVDLVIRGVSNICTLGKWATVAKTINGLRLAFSWLQVLDKIEKGTLKKDLQTSLQGPNSVSKSLRFYKAMADILTFVVAPLSLAAGYTVTPRYQIIQRSSEVGLLGKEQPLGRLQPVHIHARSFQSVVNTAKLIFDSADALIESANPSTGANRWRRAQSCLRILKLIQDITVLAVPVFLGIQGVAIVTLVGVALEALKMYVDSSITSQVNSAAV